MTQLVITGSGGEYALGSIISKSDYERFLSLQKSGELSLYHYDEGKDIEFYQYDDVLNQYGIDVSCIKIEITTDDLSSILFESCEPINNIITQDNPYIENKIDGVYGYFGGVAYEKRMTHYFNFPDDFVYDDTFNMDQLYFLTVNMDETIDNSQIITEVLYIKDIYKALIELGADIDDDDDDDDLHYRFIELFEEYDKEVRAKILSRYSIESAEIEPGIPQHDSVVLLDENGVFVPT